MTYSIYMLPEGLMTITGAQLDGVTQGDGSHMVGAQIVLNSNAWVEVEINDTDETAANARFSDNDSSQRLANDLTIDGTTYSANSRVEAEYSITASDGTNTYTLVAFNVATGSPSYATIEGLAFIGPPGGFPPINVPLTVSAAQEGPDFAVSDYATPICFAAGTRVVVPDGLRAIETLQPGDLVHTCDHGLQPVRWIGQRRVHAIGRFAPIVFQPGALGNERPLRVSRQHRIRYGGWKTELMFGEEAVLIPAAHFVNGRDIRVEEGGWITYVHVLFDDHQILLAEGVQAESFHPAKGNLDRLSAAGRDELLALFPELAEGVYGPSAHVTLKSNEARALLSA